VLSAQCRPGHVGLSAMVKTVSAPNVVILFQCATVRALSPFSPAHIFCSFVFCVPTCTEQIIKFLNKINESRIIVACLSLQHVPLFNKFSSDLECIVALWPSTVVITVDRVVCRLTNPVHLRIRLIMSDMAIRDLICNLQYYTNRK